MGTLKNQLGRTDETQEVLQALQYRAAVYAFVVSHHAQNAVERSDAQRGVVWYGYAMMRGLFGLKNNVTALLMNDTVVPIAAETLNELAPGQISWQFHPKATISSRTK